MRRARGCGLFSSQRLHADALVPREKLRSRITPERRRFWTPLRPCFYRVCANPSEFRNRMRALPYTLQTHALEEAL